MTPHQNVSLFLAAFLIIFIQADFSQAQNINQKVLSQMHMVNQLEMKVGKWAWKKAATAEAREYGERLFRDHRSADRMVTNIAEKKDIMLKNLKPPKMAQKMVPKLNKIKGNKFDRLYLKFMVKSHKKAIRMLSKATKKLNEGAVKNLVLTILPILKQHLTLANHLQTEAS